MFNKTERTVVMNILSEDWHAQLFNYESTSLIIFRLSPSEPLLKPNFLLLVTAFCFEIPGHSEIDRFKSLQGSWKSSGLNMRSSKLSAVSSDSVLEIRREYFRDGSDAVEVFDEHKDDSPTGPKVVFSVLCMSFISEKEFTFGPFCD